MTLAMAESGANITANTSEYVAVHAAMEPARTAVVLGGKVVTYGLMYQHIQSFTLALHQRGIRQGDRCIVKIAHPYVHWLILLALENLAAVSCSVSIQEGASLQALEACADKLISQNASEPVGPIALVHVRPEWVQSQLDAHPDEVRYRQVCQCLTPQAGQRIKRSSGTTGGMKNMLFSHQGEEALIRQYADVMGFTRDTRYLVVNSFVVSSVYLCATLCVRLSAMVLFESGENRLELIRRQQVTHVRFFQQQLLDMLKEIESGGLSKPKDLTVILGAAPVSRALWDHVLRLLARNIVYTYNANECGSICVMGPDGLGAVRPGVQVSIVDADDRVQAPGQTGRIRVKVPHMVRGYMNNPRASGQNFKDGWFYTGDAGHFVGHRLLRLSGRIDDVLIFAGFKRSAHEYEAEVCTVSGVADACALAVPDRLGVDRLVICAVVPAGLDRQAMVPAIRKLFPPFITEGASVFFVESLPRTENGKLQRAAMKARLPQLTGGHAL